MERSNWKLFFSTVKYHPEDGCHSRGKLEEESRKVHGRCDLVSLTGAVAFEKVAKVRIRQVQLDRDPMWSVRTYTCQTVRMTIRAGMKGRNFGSVFGRS